MAKGAAVAQPRLKRIIRDNRAIIAAGILGLAVLATPSVVSAAIAGSTTASGTGYASCLYGYRMTGGGPSSVSSNYYGTSSSDEYEVLASYPSGTTQSRVTGKHVRGTYSSSYGWRYYNSSYSPPVKAVCVK